jgi:site-specific DNA recombinase
MQIDPALIEEFGRLNAAQFDEWFDSLPQAYLRAIIDLVEVDDTQIRTKGSKDVLERAVLAGGSSDFCSQMSTEWRARRDSNS